MHDCSPHHSPWGTVVAPWNQLASELALLMTLASGNTYRTLLINITHTTTSMQWARSIMDMLGSHEASWPFKAAFLFHRLHVSCTYLYVAMTMDQDSSVLSSQNWRYTIDKRTFWVDLVSTSKQLAPPHPHIKAQPAWRDKWPISLSMPVRILDCLSLLEVRSS